MRAATVLLWCSLIQPLAAVPAASLIYVKADAVGTNTGVSWTNAYTNLQSALTASASGDEIWVAAGTYRPGTIRTDSFMLKSGVTLYGGFAGTETLVTQRNWNANPAILSGDIGTPGNPSDNSYHVVIGAANAALDGFRITAGNADFPWSGSGVPDPRSTGGGMMNWGTSPTVRNCTFQANSAVWGGATMSVAGAPLLESCRFVQNTATIGGAVMTDVSGVKLTNCTFGGNSANYGSVVCSGGSTPVVKNCTFSGNPVPAIYILSSCIVVNSIFRNNGAGILGSPGSVSYSNVQGGYSGIGNINVDPLFVDGDGADNIAGTVDDDLRLQLLSPCVDSGTSTGAPPADIVGVSRPQGPKVDMGAYELPQNQAPVLSLGSNQTIIQGDTYLGLAAMTDSDSAQWSIALIFVGNPPNQNLPMSPTNPRPFSQIYASAGSFTFTGTATDDQGATSNVSSVVLTVLSRDQANAQLQTDVQALVTSNKLSPSYGMMLNQILDSVALRLGQNRLAAAASLLRSFVNYLMRMPLSNPDRQPLLDLANMLIANLTA